ncbi:BAG family molecular chaperone regulator 1 [Citrus sinensis]|uniref:BAG family molecular chaperone regulator 1 n=1 Tax=Citrus sinensis TaxID=2711 RepID=A0ACB8LWF1_CITSI|nr:BAG family molecular chaperone regulator 1 [Citrus sinensis]
MLSLAKSKSSSVSSRVDMNNNNNNPGELEIRPGGMFVQMRNSESSNRSSVSVPTIKVRVKFGSTYHEVLISPQASFGELKKMLSERTGLHPEEQKLIYKKKERDSKGYLDVARVRDGSKIVLVEDIINRERRCLEMLKIAKFQKDSNSIAQICLQVDKFAQQVTDLEAIASRGVELTDDNLDNLIGNLMTELVKLDEIVVEGDLNLQKRKQEKRVQSYIETLDLLKLCNTKLSSKSGEVPLQKQEHSYGKVTVPLQKQAKQRNLTELKHPFRDSDSFVVTTKWETFD